MTTTIIRIISFISVIFCTLSAAAKAPKVLEFFPQCDYQILDTKTYKYKIAKSNKNSVLTQQDLSKTITILLGRMRTRAIELDADAILLVDREIQGVEEKTWTKNQDDHILVKYTAEFINQCEAIQSRAKKPTPFDKSGAPQKQIQLGKVGGWQRQITFAMPNDRKRVEPELTNSLVSLDTGLYGVKLSSTFEQVIKKFGTPTMSMRLNTQQLLIAYGRNHWLWFSEGLLVKVATDAGMLSTEFTNFLAFDDRFEAQDWLINGSIKKHDSYQQKTSTTSHNGKTLKILSDTYLSQSSDKSVSKVIGFEMYLNSVEIAKQPLIASTNELQDTINRYLASENSVELLVSQLDMEPIARIWKDSTTELLLFNQNIVIEVTGKSVSSIHYLESAFDYQPKLMWQFRRVEQGQTLQHVMSMLGDEAFEFDGVVEYSSEKYQKELYFEDVDGQMRLYAAEVTVY